MVSTPHPLAASAGLSIAAATLVAAMVPAGGLAPAMVVAAVAAGLGAPLASRLWSESDRTRHPVGQLAHEVACVVLLSSGMATFVHGLAEVGLVAVLWAMAYGLRRHVGSVTMLLAGCVTTALLGGMTRWSPAAAMVPAWSGIWAWGAEAAGVGLLVAGVGTAGWGVGMVRRPGDRGSPWGVVGAGILALLVVCVACGTVYEFSDGADTHLPVLAVAAAMGAGATAWCAQASPLSPPAWQRALAGLVLTLWFAGPAAGVQGQATAVLLPLLIATSLVWGLRTSRAKALRGMGAAVAVGAAAGSAVLPGTAQQALVGGLTLVAAFWVVASPTAQGRT